MPPFLPPLYELACRIFRELALILQYSVVLASVTFSHLPCFPSAIPAENLKVASRNIGSLAALKKSFQIAWNPLPKEQFATLRILHDIVYKPASGLCLGGSLFFLSLLKEKQNLDAATKTFQWGAPETAVKMQALYDALLDGASTTKNHDDTIHAAIIQSIAQILGFERAEFRTMHGDTVLVSKELIRLAEGNYLIQFMNHTVAFVKTPQCQAVFDISEGLGIALPDQERMLAQLLKFYGTGDWTYFKLIHIS